ncbi:peptidase S45 [Tamilnaduibacter salinus]|uniref:Peptidase S45 n=2 Tax=Tamilnaduibacter salinus TaxID=1484056 RepID=A0A2A2I648_9GAMM|nr:peptidase S45 [Tamilnaduibacter salinus]
MSSETVQQRGRWLNPLITASLLSVSAILTGCFDDDNDAPPPSADAAPLFPENGDRQAEISRTTNGVPHIKADDLSSAAYGLGYAQAEDNLCVLAEAFVTARSERAKYFGPGPQNANIILDFSQKAQGILSGAEAELQTLSDESRAMLTGFTAGYNQYVGETAPSDYPAECRDEPWVTEISPANLLAQYRLVGQFASGQQFATGAVYLSVPPSATPNPKPVASANTQKLELDAISDQARQVASRQKNVSSLDLGSNGWAIGKDMTEQGRGALLANPHFPYTGPRRLYQSHLTVDGYLNVNGAGLLGTAIPLINYNENLAWTHTVTTSRRFTLYELELKSGDNMTYVKDGEEKPITTETFQIEVANGTQNPDVLERTFYYSEYGPMVSANALTDPDGPAGPKPGGLPKWGGQNSDGETVAYTYRDANANAGGLLDTWLSMSRADNLDQFKDVFREQCGTTLWTNTLYTDKAGNAFYMDTSSVPHLSEAALAVVDLKRRASASYSQLFDNGLTLLDGSTSRDDWIPGDCGNGLVPYNKKPKLQRTDFVQNSNSSYWSTNPDNFLTGYSPLFGAENAPINMRTRLGLTMLQNPTDKGFAEKAPAGQDGKFNAKDLIDTIYNNRAWYAYEFLDELRERCTMIGTTAVNLPSGGSRQVDQGCATLQSWDGVFDKDSVGAHVFRVFIGHYDDQLPGDLTEDFNPLDPVGTPGSPSETNKGSADDVMLQSLAAGLEALDSVNIGYNEPLGNVQYFQPTGGVTPTSTSAPIVQSPRIPWHGGDGNVSGAFNAIGVVDSDVEQDTVIPRQNPTQIEDTAGLSDINGLSTERAGWPMARGTSWHFGLEFTDNGPQAFGLVSYSQSNDAMSDFFTDQSERYSNKNYREFAFTEDEIEANLLPQGKTTISE